MVYVDNQQDLEANNPSVAFGCYADLVFEPSDMLLQIPNIPFSPTGYSLTINLCNVFGNYLETVTDYFQWFFASVVINGVTTYYCNIRGNNFSAGMLDRKCFTLRIIASKFDGIIVYFDKWTQKYLIQGDGMVLPSGVIITIDGGDGTNIATLCEKPIPSDICKRPLLRIVAYSPCMDSLTDYYYGDHTTILFDNTQLSDGTLLTFPYVNQSYIYGRRNRVPKEIKRTVSFNCRTQLSQTIQKWTIDGATAFPDWKVEDLEAYLFCDFIYIDDVLYQSEGGTIFIELLKESSPECIKHYLLSMPIQECTIFQVFGCTPECSNLDTFYPIVTKGNKFYNAQKKLIANNVAGIVSYFKSINGVTAVYNPIVSLDCPMDAVIQVQGNANLDDYIYVDNIYQTSRVYALRLETGLPNINALCRGVTNESIIHSPEIGDIVIVPLSIADPMIGEINIVNIKNKELALTEQNSWAIDRSLTYAFIVGADISMSLVVSNPAYTTPFTLFSNEFIGSIEPSGIPRNKAIITGGALPSTTMVIIETNGNIYFSGYPNTEDGSGSTIELFGLKYSI